MRIGGWPQAVTCAYRKSGLVWKRDGEIHRVETPDPLPDTTATKQSLLDFDGFVQDILENPRRAMLVGQSVRIYLPAHRQEGIRRDHGEAVHSLDQARQIAFEAQDTDYFGVGFGVKSRSSRALTIAAWDLTSEARVAFTVPVKKTLGGPIKVAGRPEELPSPPSL